MAKGKSNPKTVERVKGLTKAMRGELELAEAEAAAKEMEMGGKFAKDKKKGRGKRDAISSDDDDDEVTNNTVNTNSTGKPTPKAKVQIGGFGIGCRGTGNEKAKQLKLEHDEKTKAKKAARVAAATKKESARVNAHTTHDSDDDESWRVRNPTHNKKANRKKKGVGKNQTESYASDDDVADIETLATRMEMEDENEIVEGEETREGGNALNPNPKGGSTTVSAFSLLRGDEEEEETEKEMGLRSRTTTTTGPIREMIYSTTTSYGWTIPLTLLSPVLPWALLKPKTCAVATVAISKAESRPLLKIPIPTNPDPKRNPTGKRMRSWTRTRNLILCCPCFAPTQAKPWKLTWSTCDAHTAWSCRTNNPYMTRRGS